MLLSWKIRYINRSTRELGDRHLCLITESLNPVDRAAIELVAETRDHSREREILRYRGLFVESDDGVFENEPRQWKKFSCFSLLSYFEDEQGNEVDADELGQILTGIPTVRSIPSGAEPHDIDYMLAEPSPVQFASVHLTAEELRTLGYFARDIRELVNSSFMKNPPGSLHFTQNNPEITTAANSEEIRSFVTIFRRLYMSKEPANLVRSVEIVARELGSHPLGNWLLGTVKKYEANLVSPPELPPSTLVSNLTFSCKRLIDVFLYTQYAHQPDETRQRQFNECLTEVGGVPSLFTWLFLTEIWKRSLEMRNAGKMIVWWFSTYCQQNSLDPDVLQSLHDVHSGIGADEKLENRADRLLTEATYQLAAELWHQADRPDGGPSKFLAVAEKQLKTRLSS